VVRWTGIGIGILTAGTVLVAAPSTSPRHTAFQPVISRQLVSQNPPVKASTTTVTVKKDTVIGIRIDDAVSSETVRVEDRINAKVSRNVIADGVTAIPAGTRVEGTVVLVERPTPASPRGKIGIRFTSLVRPDNSRVQISTDTIYREADPNAGNGVSYDVNAFSAVLAAGRAAPARSSSASPTSSATPIPPGLREVQLPAGSLLTVHLTSPLSITVSRDPQ
jgi:hypothetical protein